MFTCEDGLPSGNRRNPIGSGSPKRIPRCRRGSEYPDRRSLPFVAKECFLNWKRSGTLIYQVSRGQISIPGRSEGFETGQCLHGIRLQHRYGHSATTRYLGAALSEFPQRAMELRLQSRYAHLGVDQLLFIDSFARNQFSAKTMCDKWYGR